MRFSRRLRALLLASATLAGCGHSGSGLVPSNSSLAPQTTVRAATSIAAAAPDDVVAINVGGGATNGFAADEDGSGGATSGVTATIDTSTPNAAPAAIYRTQRYGAMTYTIPHLTAGTHYDVRLHFAETYFGLGGRPGAGSRVFDVAVNATPVLQNFDIFAAAGTANKAVVRDFAATATSSGTIVVALTKAGANVPALNGIEILTVESQGVAATAIDVGGSATGAFGADVDGVGGVITATSDAIDVSAANAAPEAVYQTQRYGPMTYAIPGLTPNGAYDVRLHFAELYWGVGGRSGGTGSRLFDVAIDGTQVLTNLDVYARAGGGTKALVIDTPATADASGTITIAFANGAADNPMVSGIQIIPAVTVGSEMPTASDAFVDSIGVNTHLSNFSTLYGENFALIESLLTTAGIRHIRDGTPAGNASLCRSEATLGAAGTFMDVVADGNTSDLATGMSCLGSTADSIEGVNEADLNDGADWVTFLRENTQAIATAYPHLPLIAPSVTTIAAEQSLGSIASIVTDGNAHAYFAGRNPGTQGWGGTDQYGTYGSLAYNLNVAAVVSGTKPIDITETGYSDAVDEYALPAVTKARYTLRTLLDAWNAGVPRTFIYELVDEGNAPFSHYGLVSSTGSPKPAYTALANLIHQLSDPGSAFSLAPLHYTLSAPSTVRHTLLERRDSTYELVVWNEVPEWNPNANATIATSPQPVSLTFAVAPASLTETTFADDGSVTTTSLASKSSLTVAASAWPTIVDIKP